MAGQELMLAQSAGETQRNTEVERERDREREIEKEKGKERDFISWTSRHHSFTLVTFESV